MEVVREVFCKHCGRPALNSAFCCSGCEAAYDFIQSIGMGDFYKKLSRPLDPVKKNQFKHWDYEDITSQYVEKVNSSLCKAEFLLNGVNCPACGWLIERAPLYSSFIKRAEIDLGTSKVKVLFDQSTPFSQVGQLFNQIGYFPVLADPQQETNFENSRKRKWLLRTAVALASQMASMHVNYTLYAGLLEGMSSNMVRSIGLLSLAISLPAVFYSAVPFYQSALSALKLKTWNLDVLVSASVILGFVLSSINAIKGINDIYFDAITMLIAFLLLGRYVVMLSEKKISTHKSVLLRELLGENAEVPPGSKVTVRSGEAIPCDGVVIQGQSEVNQAWLTGEEIPVRVQKDQQVYAGSVNIGEAIVIRSTEPLERTRVAKLLSSLVNVKKGKLSLFSEKFEKILVAIILLVVMISGGTWLRWISLLIVACPCALGLAVPAVLSTAMRQGLRRGIIVKGADIFERLAQIDTVVFDKTGTLTTSDFVLSREDWDHSRFTQIYLEQIISFASRQSSHPLLSALRKRFQSEYKVPSKVNVREILGQGLIITTENETFKLGRQEFAAPFIFAEEDQNTKLYFSAGESILAKFQLKGKTKSEAPAFIQYLKHRFSLWILSGDNSGAVKATGAELGFDPKQLCWEQSPNEKMNFLEKLFDEHRVAMVGDGINDSLAFKKSHVGIGMGGNVASTLESCDVFIPSGNLDLVRSLFEASSRVKRGILICLGWAVVYNVIGITLVLKGFLGPLVCATMMPLSSITVVSFATLTKYFKEGS